MAVPYTLSGAINDFFIENTSVIRQQCDDFVLSCVGGPVIPVEIQGMFSYTLTAGTDGSKLFQFRVHDSKLDTVLLDLAKIVHPQFVTGCKYHGTIAARFRQCNTTKDLAKFFAQSWNNGQQLCPDKAAALLIEFRSKLDRLSLSLPSRFATNLDAVRKELPLLFSERLPFILSHQDLNEMNMLINPETGCITGIVDWAEARILSFGFSLWAFENLLGYMDSEGWHYYDNRHELEGIFWQTFLAEANSTSDGDLQLIRVARMAGLFFRYGFDWDGEGVENVVDESSLSSLAYLDAFCTSDDWAPTRAASAADLL
ncbi:hypothetical protein TRIATDRAFT_214538 [Trichoderma atroviride IMI 206040]|uniref:Aminoglycoside phosphotransferase domain-containing protein n=1 Tax=Hypocrea atroviridis (strain ATCC 20476 / IMI 206040) TaxID=452589 RepID=G9NKS0_HYPAI|nr:uncharacterized protein TRIATDRAFT_214538 [Trichoderma atroviride IMI 206040]EHK48492.1 hypothetical protein TRIATDRAFT_214538 [Trichoderma atroviride IMI 206040]